MPEVTAGLLWEIFTHARSWLANLRRASDKRKVESIHALRGVVSAARQTATYIRKLEATNERDYNTEANLSVLWTDLGFALEDLGLGRLAKKCQIKGKHWSNPNHFDADFLAKADISLDTMETLARQILAEVNR